MRLGSRMGTQASQLGHCCLKLAVAAMLISCGVLRTPAKRYERPVTPVHEPRSLRATVKPIEKTFSMINALGATLQRGNAEVLRPLQSWRNGLPFASS